MGKKNEFLPQAFGDWQDFNTVKRNLWASGERTGIRDRDSAVISYRNAAA